MEYRRLSLAYGSELEEVTSLSLVLVEAMVFSGILTAQLWGAGVGGREGGILLALLVPWSEST